MMDELVLGRIFSWVFWLSSAQQVHYHNSVTSCDLISDWHVGGITVKKLTCNAISVVYWVTCKTISGLRLLHSSHKSPAIFVLGENS
jgi:hypothetical protein